MMIRIPALLTPEQVSRCTALLADANWIDGRATAGAQAGLAKRNLQLSATTAQAQQVGEIVLRALAASPRFVSAALPLKILPPMFNRYSQGMAFGPHIDNAIHTSPLAEGRYRTDISCTLFLSEPAHYAGGELVIQDTFEPSRIKLPAGDLILYPATRVHRVEPVTRGERWASFFWVQSIIADEDKRRLLYELDEAVAAARKDLGDRHSAAIALIGHYHNLVRMWGQF